MYPYEIQHRRGEPLEIRGDYKVDLVFELYIIKSIFELIMYSSPTIKMKEPLTISFNMLQYYGNNLPLS